MYCFSITTTFASLEISLGSPTIPFLIVFSMKEGTVPSVVGSVEASYIGVQTVASEFYIFIDCVHPDDHCGIATSRCPGYGTYMASPCMHYYYWPGPMGEGALLGLPYHFHCSSGKRGLLRKFRSIE